MRQHLLGATPHSQSRTHAMRYYISPYINIKIFRMEIFTLIPLLRIACVEKRGVWRAKKPTV